MAVFDCKQLHLGVVSELRNLKHAKLVAALHPDGTKNKGAGFIHNGDMLHTVETLPYCREASKRVLLDIDPTEPHRPCLANCGLLRKQTVAPSPSARVRRRAPSKEGALLDLLPR
jgi:hypothetical protein